MFVMEQQVGHYVDMNYKMYQMCKFVTLEENPYTNIHKI